MWIPKCCNTDSVSVKAKMRNQVTISCKKLATNTENGIQKNTYSPNVVLTKRCHIKDRSVAAQDTAINNGIRDAETAKEFIFEHFNVTDYQFNQIEWGNSKFKVLSTVPLATVNLDGKKYKASDLRPFISILAGIQKL